VKAIDLIPFAAAIMAALLLGRFIGAHVVDWLSGLPL
jgi:hypothetical protein